MNVIFNVISQGTSVQGTLTGAYSVPAPGRESDPALALPLGDQAGWEPGEREVLVQVLRMRVGMSRGEGRAGGDRGRTKAAGQGREQGSEACWSDAGLWHARMWHLDSTPKAVTRH